jgi:hypothetical protein
MIRRLVILLIAACVCYGPVATAADLPLMRAAGAVQPRKAAVKPKKSNVKTPQVAIAPKQNLKQQADTSKAVGVPKGTEIDLQWVLDPLVATADGSKTEGSASAEANLIVVEPGSMSSSYMVIELSGHVVKTAQTTARIDVRIGDIRRTVSWKTDDVESGRFKVEFRADIAEGKLPDYFPVSAIALVTNGGKATAVMVSLDKIGVRVGNVLLAQTQ